MRPKPVNTFSCDRGLAIPDFIPIYRTDFSARERAYVMECFDNNHISSGRFVLSFEDAFATSTGARHAICVSSGYAALHLALHALGIGEGDEVIVPTLTFIATANAVAQTGAKPVFVDCDPETWLLTSGLVQAAITERTKAIIPAHLYGGVCNMAALREVADEHGLDIVEDCAQAIGARYLGRSVGNWATAGTFSFFGNKTITTGEGGMIVTECDVLAERVRSLRNQAFSLDRRYWHLERGFNYKMTDLSAAVGLAQMYRLPHFMTRKREIFARYRAHFSQTACSLQHCGTDAESGAWMFSLLLPENVDRRRLIAALHADRIEVRPVFHCLHMMPPYYRCETFPQAERIARLGVSLPSFPGLSDAEVDRISCAVIAAMATHLSY